MVIRIMMLSSNEIALLGITRACVEDVASAAGWEYTKEAATPRQADHKSPSSRHT